MKRWIWLLAAVIPGLGIQAARAASDILYIDNSTLIQTWDFTNSSNPDWTLGRRTYLTLSGLQLGSNTPPTAGGAMVGMMRIAPPDGLTYCNSGVEMTFSAPIGADPPTEGFEFLALYHDDPRDGFGLLSKTLAGGWTQQAHAGPNQDTDGSWSGGSAVDDGNFHTMAVVRYVNGIVRTYIDGVLVNSRASDAPSQRLEWIGIGQNAINGNYYMPIGSIVSRVRAFAADPPAKEVDTNLSTVVVWPPSAWADGSSAAIITVTLLDADGWPVTNKVVGLEIISGDGSPVIATNSGTTGADGKAVFSIVCTNVSKNVFAVSDITDARVLSAKATVEFLPHAPLHVTVSFFPEGTPASPLSGPGWAASVWNTFDGGSDYQNKIASGLLDDMGPATAVGFNFGLQNAGTWGAELPMLSGALFKFGAGPNDLMTCIITGLPPVNKYDLYLASYYKNEDGSKATFTMVNSAVDGGSKTVDNGGGNKNSAKWQLDQNYTVFRGIEADSTNRIVFTVASSIGRSMLSGFQLVDIGPPPQAPGNLVALAGDAQVYLFWQAVDGATAYNIKRSTTNGMETLIARASGTNYTDWTVSNGPVYYYVVSATNNAGESAWSPEGTARPAWRGTILLVR